MIAARVITLVVLAVFCGISPVIQTASRGAAIESPNLIQNPSFERGDANGPAGWRPQTWGGRGEFEYATQGRSGKRSVMIASQEGADIGWQTSVAVSPFSRYRLSAWIKTENVRTTSGKGALLNLHNIQPLQTPPVSGTRDWTKVELLFDSESNDVVEINCLFGGWGLATGTAWFDDLRLELISAKDMDPAVTINAASPREPISKYIYGQFIEHLGRCIYGGIWAEMLEDRKFYYPIKADGRAWGRTRSGAFVLRASPWQILGGENAVTMVREGSYVGEHTPRVQLPGDGKPRGIVQGDLALIKGKEYTGRVVIAGDSEAAPIEVSLTWGDGKEARQTMAISKVEGEFAKVPFRFTAGATTDDGRLDVVGRGKGAFRIGTVSLMPADNVRGMRADTLKLLKELDAPVYRWPGGNFVSGYDWKDGVGDPDQRPPRKNPAWTGIEHNDFGIHEFIAFCRELNTEPLVVVNTGLGTADLAAQEIEYCNGGSNTPMGKLRVQNGHPEPFQVKWWGIGNEMYGSWQLGHMPLEEYVKKHNEVVEAMRAVDSSIQVVAVGAVGTWSETMLTGSADHMDLISEHFYCQQRKGLMSHVAQIPSQVKRISNAHRTYRKTLSSLTGKDIRIAMDEWNYWYGPHVFGELGTRYFLQDALGIAAGLHEFFRNSDIVFMANYAQTVNVIGCIKTTKTAAQFDATGLVLKLYRSRFGVTPVEVTGQPDPLDVAAAWTEDHKALTVAVLNPTETAFKVRVDYKGLDLSRKARLWRITGADRMAYNEPGKTPAVRITEKKLSRISSELEVPPMSVSLYELPVE